jgi:hypothetical protein
MDDQTLIIILAALIATSEALALIPGIASNSIFQLIYGVIKYLFTSKTPKAGGKPNGPKAAPRI